MTLVWGRFAACAYDVGANAGFSQCVRLRDDACISGRLFDDENLTKTWFNLGTTNENVISARHF